MSDAGVWQLVCPSCHEGLTPTHEGELTCPRCRLAFRREAGIWHFLVEARRRAFEEFVARYETVRTAEGRHIRDPRHLRALPFRDLSRKRRYEWAIRSRSFRALLERVIAPLERGLGRPLRILDLGSGLGWLAYRLTARGHDVAAVDLLLNEFDGLGAHRHYDRDFLRVQAEFDSLPFRDENVDVVVFNAAFHYAADYAGTLREALRVLAPGGRVVIMDTPLYRDPSSGEAMVREREASFEGQYGLRPNAVRSEGFLTYRRLEKLEHQLDVRWELAAPWYGVRWWLRPWIARMRGTREPARFELIVGRRR
jgi:SAM-dependent methyltransferase